jgi:hypothetical protein
MEQSQNNKEEPIQDLQGLIDFIKVFSPEGFGNLLEKPLRICIDSKQVITIESIEVIPRTRDLTLLITTTSNVGFQGSMRDVLNEENIYRNDSKPEQVIDEVPMITQESLIKEFNKPKQEESNGTSEGIEQDGMDE